jgi:hypothetical protein
VIDPKIVDVARRFVRAYDEQLTDTTTDSYLRQFFGAIVDAAEQSSALVDNASADHSAEQPPPLQALKPGDRVLIATGGGWQDDHVGTVLDGLGQRFPGVEFTVVDAITLLVQPGD